VGIVAQNQNLLEGGFRLNAYKKIRLRL